MENPQSPIPLLPSAQTPARTASFDKDIEIQSTSSEPSREKKDDGIISSNGSLSINDDLESGNRGARCDGGNVEGKEDVGLGLGLGVLGRITKTSTKSSWKDPGPPPDGGWSGWMQGVLNFLLVFWFESKSRRMSRSQVLIFGS